MSTNAVFEELQECPPFPRLQIRKTYPRGSECDGMNWVVICPHKPELVRQSVVNTSISTTLGTIALAIRAEQKQYPAIAEIVRKIGKLFKLATDSQETRKRMSEKREEWLIETGITNSKEIYRLIVVLGHFAFVTVHGSANVIVPDLTTSIDYANIVLSGVARHVDFSLEDMRMPEGLIRIYFNSERTALLVKIAEKVGSIPLIMREIRPEENK